MKKSKIALGVVVALGLAWVGGAWVSGKTAEKAYQHQIEQMNQQLHTFGK